MTFDQSLWLFSGIAVGVVAVVAVRPDVSLAQGGTPGYYELAAAGQVAWRLNTVNGSLERCTIENNSARCIKMPLPF